MKKNICKFICIIIAVTVITGTLPVAASADKADIIKGTFTYMPSFVDNPAQENFYYSDDYFTAPSTEENQHLLTMSLALAFASMEIEGSSYIKKLYNDIGFSDIQVSDMDITPTRDSIGTAIAHKKIGDSELVAVSIRGNKYGTEWAANLTAGESGDIAGFDAPAQAVIARLKEYISSHELGNVKLWIAGYSRAGSVSDLVGVYVNEHLSEFNTTADDLFVYTFEAPRCSVSPKVYDNIYCVKNKNDVITYVYPESWGLYTNGKIITIGDDKTVTTYKLDIGGSELKVPLGEMPMDEFVPFFIDFLSENLTRESFSGDCDDAVAALLELYFSKSSEEWEPTLNYLKNDFLTDIKASEKIQYIITGELMGGVFRHNSDKMYRQFTDELLMVIDETTSAEKMHLTAEEFELFKQSLYPILRAFGPLLVKDFYYKAGIDYSSVLPADYDDPDYDPQTSENRVLTYKQLKEQEEKEDSERETPSDAEQADNDSWDRGYYDGYDDGFAGKEAVTEAPLPENAEERSKEYLEAYAAGYLTAYSYGYESGVNARNEPSVDEEAEEYDTKGLVDGDNAALADARKDAFVGHYRESYNDTPDTADVPSNMVKYYCEGYKRGYNEAYDNYYEGGIEFYKELTLYHVGTFALNVKDILSEHYPQTSWAYLTALDPYYTQAPEPITPSEPSGVMGDINNDNVVDSNDALLILRQSAQLESFNKDQLYRADVDKDGDVTSSDALLVLRYSVNLSSNDIIGTKATDDTLSDSIEYWTANSPAMASIVSFVNSVTDESSENYVPPAKRVAVFDSDGTLYGELFPTYVDQCLLMHRLLHDDTYEGDPDDTAFAKELETALLNGQPEPDSSRSSSQMLAETFKGFTVEEYRAYIKEFLQQPVVGFENLTYKDGYYKPMVALVEYLSDNGFQVFIVSGTERTLLRELSEGKLDEWIPAYNVIGTTFSLTVPGQGDTAGRNYNYTNDDKMIYEGNMTFKNLKLNKIVSIIDEIGIDPILAFGNSSGDFSMGTYTLQNGGKAYMLLCDDTQREYGNTEKAEKFAKQCAELGFETVSMKNDFATIYGNDVTLIKDAA